MDTIANILTHYGPWLWFAAAVALLVLETIGQVGSNFCSSSACSRFCTSTLTVGC